MKQALTLYTIISATVAISACSSLKPPVRPDYLGADQVSAAKPAQIVGSWVVTDLNPYPSAEPQSVTIEYKQDGTVSGLVIPQGESAVALGNLQFSLTGQWQLSGDTLSHSNMAMESTGDNNAVGSFISKMVSKQQAVSGQANIFELSQNRIVMVGSDGNAMEYVRK